MGPLCSTLFLLFLPAGFFSAVVSQNLVPVQFETSPVLATSGNQAMLKVVTTSKVFSITWKLPDETVLGIWLPGQSVVNTVPSYAGRLNITSTQLLISPVHLTDAGNYNVAVEPEAATGMKKNSKSVQLQVFDAVNGVSLFVPSVVLEGDSLTLTCTWTQGTQTVVIWGKGNTALTSDSRVTVSNGSLVINPVNRSDAGVYTCTVQNPISAKTASASLTVYYGPDTPSLQINGQASCVGGGTVLVGQSVQLTCTSASLPPASFSWQQNGQPVAISQPGSSVFTLQAFSTNQSGQYICMASNAITTKTATQGVNITVVSTCLSVGAVVGIVIACVVALILIIVAIVLLLRWKKIDRRLRDVTEQHKANPNPLSMLPPPDTSTRNLFWNEIPGQHLEPPLHNYNTLPTHNQRNTYTSPQDTPQGTASEPHGGVGQLEPHDQHNNTLSQHRHPDGRLQNSDSQQIPNSQQNPVPFSQMGNIQPSSLPPVIHVTLNTVPPSQEVGNSQPHTVHLNLNAYPSMGQQNSNLSQNTQASHVNQSSENPEDLMQNIPLHVPPPAAVISDFPRDAQTFTNSVLNSGALIQTGFSHRVNSGTTSQRNANTQTYWSDSHHAELRRVHLPWDRLHGTPAYRNNSAGGQALVSSSSSSSSSSSTPAQQRAVPQNSLKQPHNAQGSSTAPVTLSPNSQRQEAPQNHQKRHASVPDPASMVASQGTALSPVLHVAKNMGALNQPTLGPQSQRNQSPVGPTSQNQKEQGPLGPHSQKQRNEPTVGLHSQNQRNQHPVGPQTQNQKEQISLGAHGDTIQQLHSSTLTQAALQIHTAKTQNPFQNRKEQTRAALARSREVSQQVQRPPTPPPVMPLAMFKTLPLQRPQDQCPQDRRPQQQPVILHTVPHAQPNPHRRHAPAATHGRTHRKPHHTNRHQNPPGWPRR